MDSSIQDIKDSLLELMTISDDTLAQTIVQELITNSLDDPTMVSTIAGLLQERVNSGTTRDVIEKEIADVFESLFAVREEILHGDYSDNKKKLCTDLVTKYFSMFDKALQEVHWYEVQIFVQKVHPDAHIPQFAHPYDAGADVYAVEDTIITPQDTMIVRTGLKMAIPQGWMVSIRPRSGLSFNTDLRIANAPGTIDAGYLDEIGIIVTNTGGLPYKISAGDRIAQMVVERKPNVEFVECEDVHTHSAVDRANDSGASGFGSTGK